MLEAFQLLDLIFVSFHSVLFTFNLDIRENVLTINEFKVQYQFPMEIGKISPWTSLKTKQKAAASTSTQVTLIKYLLKQGTVLDMQCQAQSIFNLIIFPSSYKKASSLERISTHIMSLYPHSSYRRWTWNISSILLMRKLSYFPSTVWPVSGTGLSCNPLIGMNLYRFIL